MRVNPSISAIYGSTGTKITSTTDGSHERLDVNTSVAQDPTQYQLRWSIDDTGDVVGTTDVVLYTFSGIGVLDFVGTSTGSSTHEIAIKIDGVEQFRASMAELSSLGFSNATNIPVWAENANKNFRINPSEGMGFATSFSVIARSTTGSNTIKHAVLFRELV